MIFNNLAATELLWKIYTTVVEKVNLDVGTQLAIEI